MYAAGNILSLVDAFFFQILDPLYVTLHRVAVVVV